MPHPTLSRAEGAIPRPATPQRIIGEKVFSGDHVRTDDLGTMNSFVVHGCPRDNNFVNDLTGRQLADRSRGEL